jgi:hypothetical protein
MSGKDGPFGSADPFVERAVGCPSGRIETSGL